MSFSALGTMASFYTKSVRGGNAEFGPQPEIAPSPTTSEASIRAGQISRSPGFPLAGG